MDENKFLLNTIENSNVFTIELKDEAISVSLLEVPNNSMLGNIGDAVVFKIEENFNCAVYQDNNLIIVNYNQTFPKVRNVHLKFDNSFNVSFNDNFAFLHTEKNNIKLECFDARFVNFTNGILTIFTSSESFKINFFQEGAFSQFTAVEADPVPDPPVSMFTSTEVFVPAGSRGPEFSIGLFDTYDTAAQNHERVRPIRLGVPVISTVPVFDLNLPDDELYYYNQGKGPNSRTVYFRVVCNQYLSSINVKLLIYLPNGVDTITAPDFINLTLISGTSVPSVYVGEYTFYEEDTVYSVDGFVYFSIYTDIIQQASVALKADDPAAVFASSTTEIDLF